MNVYEAGMVAFCGAGITTAVALAVDLSSGKIPNTVTVCSLACGLCFGFVAGHGFLWSLTGAAAGFAVFLIPFIVKGMGAGDVKLFTALGAWLGGRGILLVALFTAIAGAFAAVCLIIRNDGEWDGAKRLLVACRTRDAGLIGFSKRFPYTVPTAIGLVTFIFLGRQA